jgi:plastocyanin|tara:strand:+ start:1393 stop:1752 length:360 start_codon:yes stop_codon:yes gene_type:complete
MKHEIMWWMSRLTIMLSSLFLSFALASQAYAAEIQMGSNGMLVFEPCELNIDVGETVTFVNNELPPHNVVFADNPELGSNDLQFVQGDTIDVTFEKAGDYFFQCDPHAGAGMKGVIHVS